MINISIDSIYLSARDLSVDKFDNIIDYARVYSATENWLRTSTIQRALNEH